MISETDYFIDLFDIIEARKHLPETDRVRINHPTNNFFYDPWELNDEYKGTVWEKIYNSLPTNKGEARIITLDKGTNYYSHSDIDDRWHLNITGDQAYLIDLDNKKMHSVEADGKWYNMDTSKIHVAANFGVKLRTQVVIRHLLEHHDLKDRVQIDISFNDDPTKNIEVRYDFDHKLCPWLNIANKNGFIDNFDFNGTNRVKFDIEKDMAYKVHEILSDNEFNIIVNES